MDKINKESPSQPQPVQPEIPSQQSNSNLLKILSIGLGVIGIGIIIGIGGYLLGTKKSQLPVQKAVSQVSPSPIPDPTANWKTYTNTEFGYQIRYPADWTLKQNTDSASPYPALYPAEDSLDYLSLRTTTFSPEDYIADLRSSAEKVVSGEVIVGQQTKTDIAGITAYKIFTSSEAEGGDKYVIGFNNRTIIIGQHFNYIVSLPLDGKTKLLEIFNKILSTFKFTDKPTLLIACKDEPEGIPVITSISPASGPVGTKVEIKGCNFSGFEGDKNAWIENSQGVSGILYGEEGSTSNLIMITLKSSLCRIDNSYSGIPCDKFLTLTPGAYKIYARTWGKNSNEVNFTIK